MEPFIIFFLIALVVMMIVSKHVLIEKFQQESHIPKHIYCYWHDLEIPDFLQFCIYTWRYQNPDYAITILNSNDAKKMGIIAYKHADTATRISDFVRLQILEDNGGIWMDISTILNAPLDWVHNASPNCRVLGFYNNGMTIDQRYPVIESWFIAAPRQSQFIKFWNIEFNRLNKFETIQEYLTNVENLGIKHDIMFPEYLTIHVAAQVVMQLYLPNAKSCMSIAEEGPFKYLVMFDWDISKATDFFASGEYKSHPMLKLRGEERKHINELLPIIKSNYHLLP